jgi:hypothetical protein
MINLVGQVKLLNILNSYTLETLPKTLLFIGEQGCGKRTFATYLANRLKIQLVDISNKYSDEELAEYQACPINKLYLIDLRSFTQKDQNRFLKFIEEPSDFSHIILVSNSEFGILDTILSRCIKYHFSQYTYDEMKQVSEFLFPDFDEKAYTICKTPGQLIELDINSIKPLTDLCTKIITSKLNYGTLMSVFTKINCFENYDQFNFDMFFNMMSQLSFNIWKDKSLPQAFKIYTVTQRFLSNLQLAPKSSKVDFVTNYLSTIYLEVMC